ncbi:N-acetyltransferase [Aeromicrobium phragmitis]|uniref:N-acetyltransferase n=1 Tax=Aeromicrobium phragmitis TaxID=2478914 RepID=A0A3L8PKC2_9ACTN|nr:N-acetyltransferase [Aeromicrobium phragmitis]
MGSHLPRGGWEAGGVSDLIETERLTLRPFRVDHQPDVEAVYEIHSDLEIVRWLDNPPFVLMADHEEARAWIERRAEIEAEDFRQLQRAIEVKATGETAGSVSIQRLVRQDGGFVGEYEIGWKLRPAATGAGYATEAARALALAAFAIGMDELVIDMYPDNAPSAAVARRLGAEELGVRDDPWYGGDSLMFRLRPPRAVS